MNSVIARQEFLILLRNEANDEEIKTSVKIDANQDKILMIKKKIVKNSVAKSASDDEAKIQRAPRARIAFDSSNLI